MYFFGEKKKHTKQITRLNKKIFEFEFIKTNDN